MMISQVLTLSMMCYRTAPQPAALELCKQFFIMYGRETGMVDPLRELLSELVNISLANIRNTAVISGLSPLHLY